MVKGYPAMSFPTRTEARDYVGTKKVDCASLGGRLTSAISQT